MRSKHSLVPAAIAVLLPLLGCSSRDTPVKAARPSALVTAPAERPKACALVTEPEMTAILGAPVVAKGRDRSTETSCAYAAVSGISPSAELKIEWGDGAAAMMARA